MKQWTSVSIKGHIIVPGQETATIFLRIFYQLFHSDNGSILQ